MIYVTLRAASKPSLIRQWRHLISQLTEQERAEYRPGVGACLLFGAYATFWIVAFA